MTGISAIAVSSPLLQVGGNPATTSGEIYTLAPSGNVIIGSASSDDPGVVLTIGSETISVKQTHCMSKVIDGSTLSASDIYHSIWNNHISSPFPSGILVAGTSTVNLEDPTPPDAIFTVAGPAVDAGVFTSLCRRDNHHRWWSWNRHLRDTGQLGTIWLRRRHGHLELYPRSSSCFYHCGANLHSGSRYTHRSFNRRYEYYRWWPWSHYIRNTCRS